jgi:hypothetical protein
MGVSFFRPQLLKVISKIGVSPDGLHNGTDFLDHFTNYDLAVVYHSNQQTNHLPTPRTISEDIRKPKLHRGEFLIAQLTT